MAGGNLTNRGVTILGSTGSIGCNTVELIEAGGDAYRVEALVAGKNAKLLAKQAKSLRAKVAVVADESAYADLKDALSGSGIQVAAGPQAVIEAAQMPADWVMASVVGAAGLAPTMEAIRRGACVGLANKECLVCAGDLMMAEVIKHDATLIPVDSEHSAVFQVLETDQRHAIDRITLTASGGPFRGWTREEMAGVTPEQAVAHPNWSMGAKISVDSASMMNKGLELIEAHHLFQMPEDRIDVLVHPQSVIHSMVSYVDGSVLAQLGSPDMRTPIAYALGWPNRIAAPAPKLDLAAVASLTFEAPDPTRFPSLRLARLALQRGGGASIVFNAANEVAVAAFLDRKLSFLNIANLVEQAMDSLDFALPGNIDDVLEMDQMVRAKANELIAILN